MKNFNPQFRALVGMSNRLKVQGGDPQQDRMIHDKR